MLDYVTLLAIKPLFTYSCFGYNYVELFLWKCPLMISYHSLVILSKKSANLKEVSVFMHIPWEKLIATEKFLPHSDYVADRNHVHIACIWCYI